MKNAKIPTQLPLENLVERLEGGVQAQQKSTQPESMVAAEAAPRRKGQWRRKRVWPEHKIVGTLICERCGKTFPAKTYQIRRNQLYCSGDCRYPEAIERFWNFVSKADGCWFWTGSKISGRYGGFHFANGETLAHRAAWTFTFGKIPEGMQVLHRCDNPVCVNPEHLFLGTQNDNVKDAIAKNRLCKKHTDRATVIAIRQFAERFGKQYNEMVSVFGLSQNIVRDIVNRRTWKKI